MPILLKKKKMWFHLVATLFCYFTISIVSLPEGRAELWQGATTLDKGEASIGGFGQFYFDPSEFMAFGQVTYGLTDRFQIEGRLGVGTTDTYLGAFGKYHFFTNKFFATALFFGYFHQHISTGEVGPVFSHNFSGFQLYLAPLVLIPLESGPSTGILLVPGIDLSLHKNLKFYTEFSLNLTHAYNGASAGVKYFF